MSTKKKTTREDIRLLAGKGAGGDNRAVDELLSLAGRVDPVLLPFVIKGLGEIKSREAFHGLLELMAERNMKDLARYLVKMVLSKEGYLQRQFLLEALGQSKDEDVLLFLVSLVGKWRLAEAEEPLISLYGQDQTPEVKGAILAALGQMGTEICLPTLKDALHGKSDFLIYNATQAMWRVGLRIATYPLLAGIRKGEQGGGLEAISMEGYMQGEDALPALVEQYRTKRPEERQMVLDSLIKIGRPAVRHLLGFLADSDENLRILAATQLGYIGDEESVDHLIAAMDTPSENTRFTLVEALGKIGHPKAVPVVVSALDDPSEQVRTAAYQALYNLDPKTFFEQALEKLPREASRLVLSGFTRVIEDSVVPQGLETIAEHLEKSLPGRARERLRGVLHLGHKESAEDTWGHFLQKWMVLLTDDQQGLAGIERLLEKMIAFSKTAPGAGGATDPLQVALRQLRRHRPVLEKAPGLTREFNQAVAHFLQTLVSGEHKEAAHELNEALKRLVP